MKRLAILFIAFILGGCAIAPESPKLTVNPGFTGSVQLANASGKRAEQVARSIESEFIRIFPAGSISSSKSISAQYAIDLQVNDARLSQTSANREEKNCARYSDPDPKAQGFIAQALSRKCLSWETKIIPCTLNSYELDVQLRIGDAQKRSLLSDRKVFQQNERVCQGSAGSTTGLMAKTEQDAGQWTISLLSQTINAQSTLAGQKINLQEPVKQTQAELEQQLRLAQTTQNQPPANTSQSNQTPPVINQGRRFALVIGNASYSSVPQLMNPTNDAREVTRALQATGFEVIRLENADLRQMQDAVRSFGNRLSKNDVGLFYFSGHGVQVKGKNYLIPVRENIKQSFEVPSGAIDADLVLATMENAKNNLNIMILDACRSPFPGEARSLSRGLATLDAAKGTLIAYATAPGKEALDGQGSNSPYTKHLVRALQQKGLPIEQVFKQVRIAVVEETKGTQVPWENSSIMGDFYFRK